jgi:hypothetical protein
MDELNADDSGPPLIDLIVSVIGATRVVVSLAYVDHASR